MQRTLQNRRLLRHRNGGEKLISTIPIERIAVRCQLTSPAQQLADAVRKHDIESVRDLIARGSAVTQTGTEGLNCAVVENAITALFEDRNSSEKCKEAMLETLTGYRGFNRRYIPGFVFKLPLDDARQAIHFFVGAGTAPRISKVGGTQSTSHDVCELVHQLQKERLEQYAEYRREKILKHNLEDKGPLSPFFYEKRDRRINLNGVIKGTDKDNESASYLCRHIDAVMRGMEQDGLEPHQVLKERLGIFSSKEAAHKLLNSIGYENLEKLSDPRAPSVQCSNSGFGKLSYKLSGELKEGESRSWRMRFQASATTGHVMTLHLQKKNGRIRIAVHDSNLTANMKHIEFLGEDKEGIANLTLQQFMTGKYEIPPETFSVFGVSESFVKKYAGRLIDQDLQCQVDSLWDALTEGGAEHILAVSRALAEYRSSGDEILQLLGKRVADRGAGSAALGLALERGHAEAMRAFGAVLKQIPEQQRADILSVLLDLKNSQDYSGLTLALGHGHAAAVDALGELLELIPENIRLSALPDALAGNNAMQFPGLVMALCHGHGAAVRAFGRLLKILPEIQHSIVLPKLLASNSRAERPGLALALARGHADAVRAFGELLKLIPENRRSIYLPSLLEARGLDGISGLECGLRNQRKDAVLAFTEIVQANAMHLSKNARASLSRMIRDAHEIRKWYSLCIPVNEPYYTELIRDRSFHKQFKDMKEALKR